MKSSSRDREADAYRNPTELFTLIKNGEPTGRIIQHALKFPQEVMTWIVSRKNSKLGDDKKRDASNDIVWRYLPIHLVCLVQNNPCKELILVMTDLFPKGIKTKDHHGNLPIHYLLAVGCVDVDILDLVLDEEYKCLDKKDGEGRTALEIVEQSNGGEECRRDMIQWFQKRYGQGTKFSPRRNTSARGSYQARECNGNGNGELVENVIRSAKGERKKFLSTIEKLEWDCEAKDQSLDMLAAQLMSVELKLKKERERSSLIERERGIHPNEANEECIRSVKSPLPQTEAVKSLKDTMKIDATIVASQQEKISELDKELDQSRKAEEGAQDKHKKLQSRIDLLDETIRRHDEVVSHARKVCAILQEELSGKEVDFTQVEKQLEMVQTENLKLKKEMESQKIEAEKNLETFQLNVRDQSETLSNSLRSLKEKEKDNEKRVQNDVGILQDQLAAKDVEFSSLQRQLSAALTKNEEISKELAKKDRELEIKCIKFSSKLQEQNHLLSNLQGSLSTDSSDTNCGESQVSAQIQSVPMLMGREIVSPDNAEFKGGSLPIAIQSKSLVDKRCEEDDTCLSADDIRCKQSQLQNELKDIYAQIRAVMPEKEENNSPPLTHSDNSSEDSENIGGEYDLRKSFVRRQRNEEIRPWRKVESAGEVYNMEAWGQRSEKSGCSIYSM